MPKTIFIIDDDPIYRLLVDRLIKKLDISLITCPCSNGEIGLEKLNALDSSSESIVLLDLNMPVLDGWGVLDKINLDQLHHKHKLTLYIVSSSTDKEDLEKVNQYSFINKFYHKPLRMSDIEEILRPASGI